MELNTLLCTLWMETIGSAGDIQKRTQHKNIALTLGRNEFRDVVLKLEFPKRDMKFALKELTIFKKFVKEGKATIKIPDRNIQFLLSNCPPDKLIMFLKTMHTKLECHKQKPPVHDRKRLLSDRPKTFEDISPLTLKDLQTVHEMRAKNVENKSDMFTPKGKGKRKRENDEKENVLPQGVKMARKLVSTSCSPFKPVLNPVKLNKGQTSVLDAIISRKNVFFTGSAGTGKSFLLRRIIGALPPQHTYATASTGVAACHIGGITLHSFAGIGSGRADLQQCVELASRPLVIQQWKKCQHLIIDEISMVEGDFFDKLETVARVVKQNDLPFGGIQLILCGDFLQLPPVTKGSDKRKFCFQAKTWPKCVQLNMELTEVKRQSDNHFINILQNVRLGRCPDIVETTLRATAKHNIQKDGILATRLCTHKEDVDQINKYQMEKLNATSKVFLSTDNDTSYAKQIDSLCPVPHKLELRVGTQVMLAKNLEVHRGLVNGARGLVTGFEKGGEGLPIVKFLSGLEEVIKPARWTFKAAGAVYLTRRQIPLKLAWAISIHKSQGMTLDCVEITVSKVFESGQAYVALSRAKSLEGLRVLDFDRGCVRANPDVLKFYHKLDLTRRMLQTNIEEYS
ncbi:ATP-dependent DNA helicase PIF1-like [Mizuhopecten yessoensis]|uniref:ATP-dependent DNA helicase PIF1 n=1 Tax=Mizuhopecten yessoensis TaxID=6573 RepID=A0A210R047_MIZYE|nr:ATP-dependent DNA helicase PIF1-like [Mizuhopecten yessoensis]OWF54393.1 ATP-dependent DNA helicase PIF1 [Mizuhopecten yessoensis]